MQQPSHTDPTKSRRWPVSRRHISICGTTYLLDVVADFEQALSEIADEHPDDTDLIPYFAELWPSAIALANYLANLPPHTLAGTALLELGCGLGLPSLVAARLQANVTASDFHPEFAAYLRANATLNNLTVACSPFDWRTPPDGIHYDWIIGSDLLYEQQQVETLTHCIWQLLKPGGRLVLADPARKQLQHADDRLRHLGFTLSLSVQDECMIIDARKPHPSPSQHHGN